MHQVLTVDDWPHRHERIEAMLRRAGVRFEARNRLGPQYVTDDDLAWASVVFLDHDMCQRVAPGGIYMGPYTDGDPCPNITGDRCGCPTGMDLVQRMIELPARPIVVVHSANQAAGPEMVRELGAARFRVHRVHGDRLTWFDPRRLVELWGLT